MHDPSGPSDGAIYWQVKGAGGVNAVMGPRCIAAREKFDSVTEQVGMTGNMMVTRRQQQHDQYMANCVTLMARLMCVNEIIQHNSAGDELL